jgi:glycosyltransferase involved in cell wall biosynthesis
MLERGASESGRHVLLLPSEEFLPKGSHLAGIFQYHQAAALQLAGFRVGTLSISQAYSAPMILRAALLRAAGKRVSNALDDVSIADMARLLIDKLLRPRKFVTTEEISGIPVVRNEGFYYLPPSARTNHIGWIRAGVVAFEEYCVRFGRPDVLHAHNSDPAGLLAHKLSKRTGLPFVITEHSTFYARRLVPRSLYPSLRRALRAANGVAAVSPSLGKLLARELNLDGSRIRCIPNVVDPEVVNAPFVVRPTERNIFSLLAIGNLIPIKDHGLLLRAFERAFGGDQSVTLRIGGDGEMQSYLQDLARDLQISDRVRFLGRLSRTAVIEELDGCDLFVLPSKYETFGVVLIEALARGKPVVSTACGGPDSFIGPDDGILVPVGEVDAMANAMLRLRNNLRSYLPGEIRARAIFRFGPGQIVRQLEQLYSDALESNV